jgi:hypothetical protein
VRDVHKPFSRGSTFSPGELRRIAHRVDRRVASVSAVLDRLRAGALLHLKYRSGGPPRWLLSDGRPVSPQVAATLINWACVVPADRALFGVPAQTWKLGASK